MPQPQIEPRFPNVACVSWWRDPKTTFLSATCQRRSEEGRSSCNQAYALALRIKKRVSAVFPLNRVCPTEVPRPRTALLSQLDKNGSKSMALGARAEESEVPDGVSVVIRHVVCQQFNELPRRVTDDDFSLQFVIVGTKADFPFRARKDSILGERTYLPCVMKEVFFGCARLNVNIPPAQ